MPASPSMYVMPLRVEAVLRKAGSYDMSPSPRRSVARIVPSEIGISTSVPVRLSRIASVSSRTRGHVRRVEEALGELGVSNPTEVCKGMKGLIAEGEELMQRAGDPIAKDAALIGAAQRVEHYEIAGYGTARQLGDDCGFDGIRDLMDQTLEEESQADKLLTKIATGGMFKAGINRQATA